MKGCSHKGKASLFCSSFRPPWLSMRAFGRIPRSRLSGIILVTQTLAFLFNWEGEMSASYWEMVNICFTLGLVVLPFAFLLLCLWMKRAGMPKVLMIPYFCLFGSVGGYLLIAALSPSVFTLLAIPFVPLAGLSLIGSLIYLCQCRPFTGFHLGAVVGIGLVLTFLFLYWTQGHVSGG